MAPSVRKWQTKFALMAPSVRNWLKRNTRKATNVSEANHFREAIDMSEANHFRERSEPLS